MKRGEVWWVDFDPSFGGEIKKKRPAIIVSNDAANHYLNRVQVVPLTTKTSRVYPGEALVEFGGGSRMTDQLTTASKKRFLSKAGALSNADMRSVDAAIRIQLALT